MSHETPAQRRERHLSKSADYERVEAHRMAAVQREANTRPKLSDPQDMTDKERKALRACAKKGGKPIVEVQHGIRRRLVDAGWITAGELVLLITKAGRAALDVPRQLEQVPVFLKQGHGLTTQPSKAVAGEPEVVDCDPHWRRKSEDVRVVSLTPAEAAKMAAKRARRAA